jgi:hypothetical protein
MTRTTVAGECNFVRRKFRLKPQYNRKRLGAQASPANLGMQFFRHTKLDMKDIARKRDTFPDCQLVSNAGMYLWPKTSGSN